MLRDTRHEVSIDAPQGMRTVTAFDPDGTLIPFDAPAEWRQHAGTWGLDVESARVLHPTIAVEFP